MDAQNYGHFDFSVYFDPRHLVDIIFRVESIPCDPQHHRSDCRFNSHAYYSGRGLHSQSDDATQVEDQHHAEGQKGALTFWIFDINRDLD
jgi:hypothetical protein